MSDPAARTAVYLTPSATSKRAISWHFHRGKRLSAHRGVSPHSTKHCRMLDQTTRVVELVGWSPSIKLQPYSRSARSAGEAPASRCRKRQKNQLCVLETSRPGSEKARKHCHLFKRDDVVTTIPARQGRNGDLPTKQRRVPRCGFLSCYGRTPTQGRLPTWSRAREMQHNSSGICEGVPSSTELSELSRNATQGPPTFTGSERT